MPVHDPLVHLPTHEVTNQVPPLVGYDAFASDLALQEALAREGAGWASERCAAVAADVGDETWIEAALLANRYGPELRSFDRYGRRVDEVAYHPAYHQLLGRAVAHGIASLPWSSARPGGHVAHAALCHLFTQVETGVMCPIAMTYAVVPALAREPELSTLWRPRVLSTEYDARCLPAEQKRGALFGMAMTEKQGGSDVRANTTRAVPSAELPGAFRLTGHKWFCSAPMSDGFLTLAQTERGLTCFLVPRFLPDGSRNRFFLQRLKDKLGNRSNASSEVEYDSTFALRVGEEGRGVVTILEMVQHTRLDAAVAPVGMMRQALSQALHHAAHRRAFGKRLIDQPLMQSVLADLALEVEAGVALCMRVARSFDQAPHSAEAAAFSRVSTAIAKYWLNKRASAHVAECLECLGGAGYVEESVLPRLYRETPVNGIWEGSGNVMCLDVLRALRRDPETASALRAEIAEVAVQEPRVARLWESAERELAAPELLEARGRAVCEKLALVLQAALLVRHAPRAVADAFVSARIDAGSGLAYGALPSAVDRAALIERAMPRTAAG